MDSSAASYLLGAKARFATLSTIRSSECNIYNNGYKCTSHGGTIIFKWQQGKAKRLPCILDAK